MKKIAFVQTYPTYHDFLTVDQWLEVENRDKWMPGILAKEAFDVELWGIAEKERHFIYVNKKFGSYPIRLFEPSHRYKRTKFDKSDSMVEYARTCDPGLFFLKGIDGGGGLQLLEEHILPQKKPFVFVIGGKYYNKYVSKATAIFYETSYQKQRLAHPYPLSLHKKIPEENLFYLPKSINTTIFSPDPASKKIYDVISVGRLIASKNHEALGVLSTDFDVAVIGDGPLKQKLEATFPHIQFLGGVDHENLPRYLNQSKVFFYSGRHDFFPRVIPEAMSVGLPCIAFKETISEEVIPENCGLRISVKDYLGPISQLLGNTQKMGQMGRNAREYVKRNLGIDSSKKAMFNMLEAKF